MEGITAMIHSFFVNVVYSCEEGLWGILSKTNYATKHRGQCPLPVESQSRKSVF